MKSFVGSNKSYVLAGFDIINPGASIGTENVTIQVADSIVYFPESPAGPFFHGLEEGNALSAPLVPELRKNSTNYVYITLSTTETAKDTRAFWDPDKEAGAGGEFTQDINTQSALISAVNVSTSSFPENSVPIAIINVGASFITDIEDARDMMFRLGTGGLSPDPLSTYSFREDPTTATARLEPNTVMTSILDPNAFHGGDKNILSLKEWMDVVMTKLKELGGTTYWYEDTSTFSMVNLFKDVLSTSIKSKGLWQSSDSTIGLLTWTEDILVQSVSDNKDIIIEAGSEILSNNQTLYASLVRDADINTGSVAVTWSNADIFVNGALGSFENLTVGDWVKKSSDPDYRYLRVEAFYDGLSGTGTTPVAAADALSIVLSGSYSGISEAKRSVYTKGIYTSSDVLVADRNDPALDNAGGDLYWLAMRSDTVMSISSITAFDAVNTLSIDITNHDGLTAKCTDAGGHGLVDGQRIGISGTTNFNGTFKVEVESTNVFYINITGGPFADELGESAYFATVTTQATSSTGGTLLESAAHGFDTDQTIVISGTTNFNGTFKVYPTAATTFTIPVTSALAAEVAGDATAVRAYVRTDLGPTRLEQGENKQIGNVETENIMSFIGMDNTSQLYPSYHITPGYNTIDGFVNYNSDSTDNLTQRVSKLTSMMADKAQDKTITMSPSGYIDVVNTLNGAARDITFSAAPSDTPRLDIIMPSSDQNNSLTLTGTISLETNQAAYIEIDRNDPNDIANLAAVTIANITSIPLSENVVIIAARLATSEVWLWDGFYLVSGVNPVLSHLSQVTIQNQNIKMVRGGTWSWDLGTNTLANSTDAYIQINGITEARNTVQAGNIVMVSDGDVAYVDINRSTGGATNLTVVVAQISATTDDLDRLVIARRLGNDVIVGSNTIKLIDNESKTLEQGMSDQNLDLLGGSATAITEATSDPTWATRGAPERTLTASENILDSIASVDTEIDKFFGQLRMTADGTSDRVIITGADKTMLDSTVIGQELSDLLLKFDGAQIDFGSGEIFEDDGTTPLGQNFTPTTVAASQHRWYSVSMIPNAIDAQGRITAQLLVLPGSADGATADLATRATFSGDKKIGQVVVQDNGAGGSGTINNIAQADIVQLGVGSGNGSGDGGSGSSLQPVSGFQAVEDDDFSILESSSDVKIETTVSNATHNVSKDMYKVLCDKSLTCSTTGATFTLSGDPSFTLAIGDIIWDNTQATWRKVQTITGTTPTAGTIDSAFPIDLAADAGMVSQAIWTKDIVNLGDATEKTRPRDFFSGDIATVNINYEDSLIDGDNVPDYIDTARMVVSAATNGVVADTGIPVSNLFNTIFTRPQAPNQIDNYELNTAALNDERLFLVYFSNPNNGSVTAQANLINSQVSFYAETIVENGGVLKTAYCMSDSSGTANNCTNPTVVVGKTQVEMDWTYAPNANNGNTKGQLQVFVDGQEVPRYVAGVTVDAYYTEILGTASVWRAIELHTDLSGLPLSIEILKSEGVVDTNNQNTADILTNVADIASLMGLVVGTGQSYTTIQSAIDAAASGERITILDGTYVENISIDTDVMIQGLNRNTTISGTVDFDVGSDYALMENIRVDGDITLNTDGIFVHKVWISTGSSVTDLGTGNSVIVIEE